MTKPISIVKTDDQLHYIITFKCFVCGKEHSVTIEPQELFLLNQGYHVIDVFSTKDSSFREKFISGLCDECQKMMFCQDED